MAGKSLKPSYESTFNNEKQGPATYIVHLMRQWKQGGSGETGLQMLDLTNSVFATKCITQGPTSNLCTC